MRLKLYRACSSRAHLYICSDIVKRSPSKTWNVLRQENHILDGNQNLVINADPHNNCEDDGDNVYDGREAKRRKDKERQDHYCNDQEKRCKQLHLPADRQIEIDIDPQILFGLLTQGMLGDPSRSMSCKHDNAEVQGK